MFKEILLTWNVQKELESPKRERSRKGLLFFHACLLSCCVYCLPHFLWFFTCTILHIASVSCPQHKYYGTFSTHFHGKSPQDPKSTSCPVSRCLLLESTALLVLSMPSHRQDHFWKPVGRRLPSVWWSVPCRGREYQA